MVGMHGAENNAALSTLFDSFNREPRVITTSSEDNVLDAATQHDRWVEIDDDDDGDPFQINTLPAVLEF